MNIQKLFDIILNRKESMPANSYVADLLNQGTDRIAQKVGEEAVEVVIASKGQKKNQIIHEVADLWFHTLVLLANHDLKPDDIYDELGKRNKK